MAKNDRHCKRLSHESAHERATLSCISFRVEGCVFTGDTLLVGGCGRTDLQGGDPGTLCDSIARRLFTLPDETLVFPAHDYQGRTSTTIGREKTTNPRLAGKSRSEFVAIMSSLALAPPKNIAVVVPANLACGQTNRDA